jgi:hypothetical protein
MNNIYQLVLISCAILSLSSWPLIPLDYHFEIRKIPISETCLVPRISDKRLCTCTSYGFLSAHKDSTILNLLDKKKTLEKLATPPGTMKRLQPLDKELIRGWKHFDVCRTEYTVMPFNSCFSFLSESILSMQSIINYQFSCPRFRHLIRYSLSATRYVNLRPLAVVTPVHCCLSTTNQACGQEKCANKPLIQSS